MNNEEVTEIKRERDAISETLSRRQDERDRHLSMLRRCQDFIGRVPLRNGQADLMADIDRMLNASPPAAKPVIGTFTITVKTLQGNQDVVANHIRHNEDLITFLLNGMPVASFARQFFVSYGRKQTEMVNVSDDRKPQPQPVPVTGTEEETETP